YRHRLGAAAGKSRRAEPQRKFHLQRAAPPSLQDRDVRDSEGIAIERVCHHGLGKGEADAPRLVLAAIFLEHPDEQPRDALQGRARSAGEVGLLMMLEEKRA